MCLDPENDQWSVSCTGQAGHPIGGQKRGRNQLDSLDRQKLTPRQLSVIYHMSAQDWRRWEFGYNDAERELGLVLTFGEMI